MRSALLALLALAATTSSACNRQPRAAPPGPPAAAALDPAGAGSANDPPASASAGAPAPAAPLVRSALAVERTQRVSLSPAAEAVVDPQATFEIELSARIPDARLVLIDTREDLVPTTGTRELSSCTRLTVSPSTPLVPGSRYSLRLDGASERELHDEAGRAYAPVTLPILAAGTPPPPAAKHPVRRKKRR